MYQSTLAPLVRVIERRDGLSPLGIFGLILYLLVHERDMPIRQGLIEVCRFLVLVEVDLTKLLNRHAQTISHLSHVAFREEYALGPTKATESGIRHRIGPANSAADVDIWDEIAAITMRHRSLADSC